MRAPKKEHVEWNVTHSWSWPLSILMKQCAPVKRHPHRAKQSTCQGKAWPTSERSALLRFGRSDQFTQTDFHALESAKRLEAPEWSWIGLCCPRSQQSSKASRYSHSSELPWGWQNYGRCLALLKCGKPQGPKTHHPLTAPRML